MQQFQKGKLGITPGCTPALFCQGREASSVNCVTSMKTVTYNSATFVMAVIILRCQ
ncbi:hypothetical protein F385_3420 [Pantoea agglomerans 299R]|nr:hypothetical protein F385_3420 [Pantoea agglomerans 299R]